MLGKLSVPGRPTYLEYSTFFLASIISLFFLPLSGVVGWSEGAG